MKIKKRKHAQTTSNMSTNIATTGARRNQDGTTSAFAFSMNVSPDFAPTEFRQIYDITFSALAGAYDARELGIVGLNVNSFGVVNGFMMTPDWFLLNSFLLSPGLIAPGATFETTVAMAGSSVNDIVIANTQLAPELGLIIQAGVFSANQITLRITNASAAGITPVENRYLLTVIPRP